MAQLNVDCDHTAKAGLQHLLFSNHSQYHILPHEQAVVHIADAKLAGDVGPPLRNEISKTTMR